MYFEGNGNNHTHSVMICPGQIALFRDSKLELVGVGFR
jgi:hypothetical protein